MNPLSDLFEVGYGHSLELNRLKRVSPAEGIPFVSRQTKDNGVAAYVQRVQGVIPNPAGDLTCALNGQGGVMATFLQERPYYTSFHIACLRPKVPLTRGQRLYYCACLWANHYRYSWGRQANRTIKGISVPSVSEIPDWVEQVPTDPFGGRNRPSMPAGVATWDANEWRPFRLSALFDIRKGKRLTKANMRPGRTPFLGSIDRNNGQVCRVAQSPLHTGNTITVNYNGSVAEAYYQPVPFWCSDDVNVLYPKFLLTPAIAMFIATLIRHEKYRFHYGRKWHLERMAESTISLPVAPGGSPDWAFMEQFIKTLPFSSQL